MIYNAIKQVNFYKIIENKIYARFTSSASLHNFQEVQQDFLNILRPKVKNYYIDFDYKITENQETSYIPTREEIFKKIIEKNSLILNLKEELGLII